MSLYFIVFMLMMILSIRVRGGSVLYISIGSKKYDLDSLSSMTFAIILFFMLLFCYGRSPDYYQYKVFYTYAPDSIDLSSFYYTSAVHTEFFWKLLCNVFKSCTISFELFVGIVTSVSFWCLHKFLDRVCENNKIFAHLWVYASFYLVYYYIGIRSGLVISLYISLVLPWLFEGKYVKYILGVLILTGFHTVSIVLLTVLLIKMVTTKTLEYCMYISGAIGIFIYFFGVYRNIINILPAFIRVHIFEPEQGGTLQILYRLTFICITVVSHQFSDIKENREKYYQTFLIGTILYFITVGIPIVSVRIFDLFSILEVVMISDYVKNGRYYRQLIWIAVMILVIFMFWYHIDAGLNRYTGYKYNFLNFPYINIFEKKDILEHWYIT